MSTMFEGAGGGGNKKGKKKGRILRLVRNLRPRVLRRGKKK